MAGLVLKLGPKERVLLNGAVIENGDKRCKFSIVSPDAKILRLKDALHPDEVKTPVARVCYTAQLILSGDLSADETRLSLLKKIEELSQVFRDTDSRRQLSIATNALIADEHYHCLKALRALLPREARILASGQMT